jgi:hypothetical protein
MRHLRPTKATPGLLCVPNGLKMYQTLLELYTSIDGITAGKSYIREYFIFEKQDIQAYALQAMFCNFFLC